MHTSRTTTLHGGVPARHDRFDPIFGCETPFFKPQVQSQNPAGASSGISLNKQRKKSCISTQLFLDRCSSSRKSHDMSYANTTKLAAFVSESTPMAEDPSPGRGGSGSYSTLSARRAQLRTDRAPDWRLSDDHRPAYPEDRATARRRNLPPVPGQQVRIQPLRTGHYQGPFRLWTNVHTDQPQPSHHLLSRPHHHPQGQEIGKLSGPGISADR